MLPKNCLCIVLFLTLSSLAAQDYQGLRVNGARLNASLARLSEFGRNDLGGVNRMAYTDADFDARAQVRVWMEEAGLTVRVDAAGNLIGHRPGQDATLPLLMTGSHIDSVPEGGNFDGDVGAMSAIEVARVLSEYSVPLRHPMEFVIFANEEGGQTGSRAMSGRLSEEDLDRVSSSGKTLREGIRFLGGDPGRIESARRAPSEAAAFLELHIEQGPVLDSEKIPIGVVQGIVGIHRWMVTVEGFANHAGTTPMDRRQDALLAAARLVQDVNRQVRAEPGRQVGTVGWMEVSPGAPNVVPGNVRLTVEMRDLDWPKIDRIFARLEANAKQLGLETQTRFSFEEIYDNPPRLVDDGLKTAIIKACEELDLRFREMPSGAGHDAQSLSHVFPIGMIFVPSRDGISHSALEYSEPGAIENGANVLLQTLLRLDRELE